MIESRIKKGLGKGLSSLLGDSSKKIETNKISINNLVSWVWLGTLVLILGTLIALLPNRKLNE